MANANNAVDHFQAAFDTSIQEFRARLNNDNLYREILQTRKIEEVYDVTDKLQKQQSLTGNLRHLGEIEPFLEGLRGYASVIEVFMQAKPDVLALLWGPIKLILQWADVLRQSMVALIDTTAEIGNLIPEFKTSSTLFGEKTAIREVCILFFRDILDFYVVALKFFSLPRLKLVFEAFWPRQRDKIKIVIGHIRRHSQLLRNEVRLEHLQAEYDFRQHSIESFEKAEASHQRQEYQSLRVSIAARTYEERLQYLDDRSCQEAGKWLMKHTEFHDWMERTVTSNPVFWLQGIPGSGVLARIGTEMTALTLLVGKTHLARAVVHETRKRGHSLFAFLSYMYSSNISALSILHSLVFQLSADDSTLQAMVCQLSGENFRHNLEAAKAVFKTVISSAGTVYITIDGLDEIESPSRCQILSILLQLSSEIDELRLLVSCRTEADITSLLKGKCSNICVNELNIRGIQSFIAQRTCKWYEERQFSPEARTDIENLLAPLADKSKGMFLYAKIVLDTIEFLEPDEILEDLKILPNTMDDAYGRILERINKQQPIVREKARAIIGWIGVSPSPITIHELEQALIIKSQGIGGTAIVKSKLPIDRICGPIIEVNNEYLQFVHFTVQEYFLSSLINTAINPKEARLALTVCCITYLCQHHHDRNIEPEKRNELILTGAYRFHDFAILHWLSLVKDVLWKDSFDSVAKDLISLLEILQTERQTTSNRELEDSSVPEYMRQIKKRKPGLLKMLCNSISFREMCDRSSLKIRGNTGWALHDPLDVTLTSIHVRTQMENLIYVPRVDQHTTQEILERHYGKRLFKCRYMYCSFRRHGFDTRDSRKSHEKEHEKPWNCNVEGCEFREGGFLSRKMRDDHLEHFHNDDDILANGELETLDENDFKNICLDLVKANDVSRIKSLAAAGMIKVGPSIFDLITCAAQYASPEMIEILLNQKGDWYRLRRGEHKEIFHKIFDKLLLSETVAGSSSKMLEFILCSGEEDWQAIHSSEHRRRKLRGLPEVLRKANNEMLDIFSRWAERDLLKSKDAHDLVSPNMIAATTGDIYREQVLLELWRKVPCLWWAKNYWRNAIINIASTTCSIELANFLTDRRVPVDWRHNRSTPTPLLHAARKTNAEAAELVKFLLFKGAGTVVEMIKGDINAYRRGRDTREPIKYEIRISEEKGARGISKWLGVTFDELVAEARKARGESENSDSKAQLQEEQSLDEPVVGEDRDSDF